MKKILRVCAQPSRKLPSRTSRLQSFTASAPSPALDLVRGSFFPLHVGPQLILLRCYASSRGGATLSAYLPPFSRGKWIRRPKHAAELPAPRNGLRARVEVLGPVDLPLTPAGDAGCDGEISQCFLFSALFFPRIRLREYLRKDRGF